MEEFQKLGYPIFSQNTLPIDDDMLERLFGDEVRAGVISHPARHRRRLEELVLLQHQSQSVGGEVHGPASEPGGARNLQLQVRSRRADLRRDRGHHRTVRHAVLLLQGSGREQAVRVRSESASKRSTTSCAAIATRSSASAKPDRISRLNWRLSKYNSATKQVKVKRQYCRPASSK